MNWQLVPTGAETVPPVYVPLPPEAVAVTLPQFELISNVIAERAPEANEVPLPVTFLITCTAPGLVLLTTHFQLLVTDTGVTPLARVMGPAGKNTGGSQVAVCPVAHSMSGGGKGGCVSLGLHTAPTVAVTVPVPPLVNVTPAGTVGLLQLVAIGNCIFGGKTDGPVPLPVTTLVTTI